MKDGFILHGKHCLYHEKHKAWVIMRDFAQIMLTGGSNFESQHFLTRVELEQYLNEQHTKLGKLLTGAELND